MNRILPGLLLMTAAMVFATGCQKPAAAPPVAESKTSEASPAAPVAEVKLQVLDHAGVEQLVASKRGKVVVLDAWSTSCPPCMAEFPKLVALSKKLGPEKLACISLSFDYEGIGQPADVEPRVLSFLQEQGATFDNVLSSEESDALYRKFELTSVPAVFVYDHQGKLVKRFDNEAAQTEADAFTYEQVEALVQELLAKQPL